MNSVARKIVVCSGIGILIITVACALIGFQKSGLSGALVGGLSGALLSFLLGLSATKFIGAMIDLHIRRTNQRLTKLSQAKKFPEAIALAIQQKIFIARYWGEQHPEFSTTLQALAMLYRARVAQLRDQVNHKEAISTLLQLRDLVREYWGAEYWGANYPDYLRIVSDVALLYEYSGDRIGAEPFYLQVIDICRTNLGKDHPTYAAALNDLAGCYKNMGRFRESETLYRQAIEIYTKRINAGQPPGERQTESPYGVPSRSKEASNFSSKDSVENELRMKFAEGWMHFLVGKNRESATTHEFGSSVAAVLANLAELYNQMGDYDAAAPVYQKAKMLERAFVGKNSSRYANILHGESALYASMGDLIAAEVLIREALAVHQRTCGSLCDYVPVGTHVLASIKQDQGEYPEAEQLQISSIQAYKQFYGERHFAVGQALRGASSLYREMGDYDSAETFALEAREILGSDAKDHLSHAGDKANMALLCAATGRDEEAFEWIQKAIAIEDTFLSQVFSMGSDARRMAYLKLLQQSFDIFLSLVSQNLSGSKRAIEAAFGFVLRRKAIAAEALAEQRDAVLGGQYPHLRGMLQERGALRMQIAQKTLAGPGQENPVSHRKILADWNARVEELEGELARQIPEMALGKKLQSIDRDVISACIPKNASLIEYVHFKVYDFKAVPARGESQWKQAHYLAFILSPGKIDEVVMMDLGEAVLIDRLIAEFRSIITGEQENGSQSRGLGILPDDKQQIRQNAGISLRALVFDRLAAVHSNRRLFLSVDGDLSRLPFEVLPDVDGHLVIDEYTISYLSTGRDFLQYNLKGRVNQSAAMVIADPDFDVATSQAPSAADSGVIVSRQSRDFDRNTTFTRLPGSRSEANEIASLLNVSPLLDSAAMEKKVKSCISPRILHIATHGFFLANQSGDSNPERRSNWGSDDLSRLTGKNLENPLLRSGLALAGANTWLRGGLLPEEAEDGILTAEDVTALDLLGTELVVLSACETGLGEIQRGEGVFGLRRAFLLAGARTLIMSLWKVPDQQTQLLMKKFYELVLAGQGRAEALRSAQLSIKAKYSHPLYWGAFICQGNPGPLP